MASDLLNVCLHFYRVANPNRKHQIKRCQPLFQKYLSQSVRRPFVAFRPRLGYMCTSNMLYISFKHLRSFHVPVKEHNKSMSPLKGPLFNQSDSCVSQLGAYYQGKGRAYRFWFGKIRMPGRVSGRLVCCGHCQAQCA